MSSCLKNNGFVTASNDSSDVTGTSILIYSQEYFARTANGTSQSSSRNMNISRTGVGRWTVSLTPGHPDGVNYHPSITMEEQSANRDGILGHIVQGSQTVSGFDLELMTGDNGPTEDTYVDTPFSIGISAPVTVIRPI